MAANGRVLTGFSDPWVALYANTGTTVTYSSTQVLARGVSVTITPDDINDDNIFYADNGAAESDPGTFTGGDLNLTVDGLLDAARDLVMGLPAATPTTVGTATVDVTHFGDDQSIPYVGFGYVARWMSDGVTSYTATVLNKVKFNQISSEAETQEAEIDWQTQEITGRILRSDNANRDWKMESEAVSTQTEALNTLKVLLGATLS